jgi:alkylated DNA nucleotide flippase Atl1
MSKKQSWIEKRDNHQHPSIRKMTLKGMMYISTPKEIDSIIKTVPKGKLITTEQIADKLAKKYKADYTCPLTTGIFVSIVANAAFEEMLNRKEKITPYWRVVKAKGRLYDKYLGRLSDQKQLLENEGIQIQKTGVKAAKYEVINLKKYLLQEIS